MLYKVTKKNDTIHNSEINFFRNEAISYLAAENTTDTQRVAYCKRRKKFHV